MIFFFSGSESFRSPTCYSLRNESEKDLPPHELQSLYQVLSEDITSFDTVILFTFLVSLNLRRLYIKGWLIEFNYMDGIAFIVGSNFI